jgi:diguanylate cyclase (GGDEF)-like protein
VALEQLGRMTDVDVAFAVLVDGQERICDDWHWARPGLDVVRAPTGSPFGDWFGSATEILRLGTTIPVDDLDAIELGPTERQLADANRVRAVVLVPVRVGDVLLGVVGLQVIGGPRAWHPEELANVELVAQLIVQAVVRTRDRGALAAANLRARRIAEYLPDGLLFLNTDLEVRWASPSFTAAWSAEDGRLDERHVFDLVHPEDRPALASIVTDAPVTGAPCATVRVRSHGTWRWTDLTCQLARDPDSHLGDEIVVSLRDVHERHLDAERLLVAAERDALTGVANRAGLERFLAVLAERGSDVVFAFCDIDRFKQINDAHGHDRGDRVLQDVAAALQSAMRPDDLLARVGGDEFAIVLCDADRPGVEGFGRRLIQSVQRLSFDDGIEVTVSVGLSAVGPATEVDRLRRDADTAMYRS